MPYLKKEALCPEPIDCKILTAALNLIVDKGYQRVSIHDIQKLSCVSIGSIYKHFGGKEGVAKALYIHLVNELDELVDDVISQNLSPIGQCDDLIEQLFTYAETHEQIISFLFLSKHADFLDDAPSLYSTQPFQKINDIIKKGVQQGQFKNIDPILIFAGIFGSSIHLILRRLNRLIDHPLNQFSFVFTNSFKN